MLKHNYMVMFVFPPGGGGRLGGQVKIRKKTGVCRLERQRECGDVKKSILCSENPYRLFSSSPQLLSHSSCCHHQYHPSPLILHEADNTVLLSYAALTHSNSCSSSLLYFNRSHFKRFEQCNFTISKALFKVSFIVWLWCINKCWRRQTGN